MHLDIISGEYLTVVYKVRDWAKFESQLEEIKGLAFNEEAPAQVILISAATEDAKAVMDADIFAEWEEDH